ncbi:hypothetical protein LUZ60_010755 [Juncus effusus]|nr:hypothetical protein LUZ60_010755 [Juncus effusus]
MATSLSRTPLSKSLSLKSPTKPSQTPLKSTHLAMVELKSRVLSSLSKLSDRDTQQIAIDDLEKLIRSLPPDGVPVLVNSLTHDPPVAAPPDAVKPPLILRRESLKLLSLLCTTHPEPSAAHLPKILNHITRRLKDPSSDSSVRDTCRDVCGTLASIYVANEATASTFIKPLMEVTSETSKAAQAGAATCLAKVVECSGSVNGVNTAPLFHKLCPRICKLLSIQGFLAKGALLSVVSSLAQVGAISPQNMQQVLQTTRDCLENSDWATRKAAADTLNVLSAHSAHLIGDGAAPTLSALESCRFDKVKPVRDSMTEALQQWKKMSDEQTTVEDSKDGKNPESADPDDKTGKQTPTKTRNSESGLSSPTHSESSTRTRGSLLEKASFLLRKKAPELNSEFFQKLEPGKSKCTDDLPVEVVAPPPPARKGQNSQVTQVQNEEILERNEIEEGEEMEDRNVESGNYQNAPEKRVWGGARGTLGMKFKGSEGEENNYQNGPGGASTSLRGGGSVEGYFGNSGNNNGGGNGNNKGSWMPIQRQLSHLERQQTSLMTMLQEFMGGSHDSMVTLENRVRGLERIVEDMARDLSVSSSSRRPSIPSRPSYPASSKYTRFMADQPSWNPRQSEPDTWQDHFNYSRSASLGNRRGLPPGGGRRGWEKGLGFRLGEGPSARSAWQASKDEATLEAIRVAGGDDINNNNNNNNISTRLPVMDRDREPMLDEEAVHSGPGAQRGEEWEAWTRSMDALQVGDVDGAYNEVLGTGDAFLLVKLMEQTGPVVDQLTAEVGNEVMHAVGQLLMEESYFDVALAWLQQLAELVMENGPDFLEIPNEGKREILINLGEIPENEIPEDWDGASPDQIMAQLASSWGINLQHLFN